MIEDQLAPLYQKIATEASEVVPVDWSELYLLGEVESDKASMSTVVYFREAVTGEMVCSTEIPDRYGAPIEIYEQLLFRTWDTLEDIYDCFVDSGLEDWRQMSLHLMSSGTFEITYYYDKDIDPSADPIAREVVWAYSEFGYTPPVGCYTRTVLDDYLESKSSSGGS